MSAKTTLITVAAVAVVLAGAALLYQNSKVDGKGPNKEDIEKIVRGYILENPQIIEEAIVKRRQMQMAEQEKKQEEAIEKFSNQLFKTSHDFVAGNPNGDVTVVEFFDYNCGFCRRAFKDVAKVIENDKNVRVVFKELPIFGEPSEQAARAAMASIKQNKYFEFHRDLLLEPGRADEAKVFKVAEKLGMDIEKLKTDMKDPEVTKALAANSELANGIGLEGTPLYIVGNQIINGAPEDLADQIMERVKAYRESGKK